MSVRGEEREGEEGEHVAVQPVVSPRDRWFRNRITSIIGGLYRIAEPIGGDGALPRPTREEVANRIGVLIANLEELRNRLLAPPPPLQ